MDSFGFTFGDKCTPDVTEPRFGLHERSGALIIGIDSPPFVEEEGDPVGVGVEITDNLDPPLWCPEEEEGVWDLIGEYC